MQFPVTKLNKATIVNLNIAERLPYMHYTTNIYMQKRALLVLPSNFIQVAREMQTFHERSLRFKFLRFEV